MAEVAMESQLDWIGIDEQTRAMRREFKAAVYRIGLGWLAHKLDLDETTLRNQVNWQPRADSKGCWKPSADAEFIVFTMDRGYREKKLGQCKERIAPVEELDPMDFVREVVAKAIAGDFDRTNRDYLLGLYQQVKK